MNGASFLSGKVPRRPYRVAARLAALPALAVAGPAWARDDFFARFVSLLEPSTRNAILQCTL
jgi:hypothetical protein